MGKRMRIRLIKQNTIKLNDEIKNKLNFYKRAKRKIRNESNKDQIRKYSTIYLDCRIKLKTNKNFTKGPRKKLKIKRIRTNLKKPLYVKLELIDKIENK
jgi:hypothetical protein